MRRGEDGRGSCGIIAIAVIFRMTVTVGEVRRRGGRNAVGTR